jgi:hypothetical protein
MAVTVVPRLVERGRGGGFKLASHGAGLDAVGEREAGYGSTLRTHAQSLSAS